MEKYFRKYFIAIIALLILYNAMISFVFSQFQFFLLNNNIGIEETKSIIHVISDYLIYFFNLFLALIIFYDMKKFRNVSTPILILTVFHNLLGITFFLIGYNKELNKNE